MPAALFGIENDGLNLVVNLLVLFLVVLYVALIVWTYFDAKRRISDPVLVMCATAASLFPFAGTMVYAILRPPEFLEDKEERELEIRAAELRLRQLQDTSCPHCEHPIERTYLRCPSCKARIKDPCEACGKPIDPRWSLCPYCETPVRQAAAPARPQPATAAAARKPRAPQAEPAAKPAPRERARKPAARQTRSPRPAGQRAATSKQRKASSTSQASPKRSSGDDEPRPAPAS